MRRILFCFPTLKEARAAAEDMIDVGQFDEQSLTGTTLLGDCFKFAVVASPEDISRLRCMPFDDVHTGNIRSDLAAGVRGACYRLEEPVGRP